MENKIYKLLSIFDLDKGLQTFDLVEHKECLLILKTTYSQTHHYIILIIKFKYLITAFNTKNSDLIT